MKKEEIIEIRQTRSVQDAKIQRILRVIRISNPMIQKKYKGIVKCIFGSYVRGEEGPGSDLDVLVEFKDDANLLDLVGISQFLEDRIHIPVDVVPIDTVREEIREQVLREAIPI
ncbi:MAG: nucleotidyltransferase family protein [Methanobacterium sp.]|jgi:predicted nucleotidyltransferase